jgi:hypothetical protein
MKPGDLVVLNRLIGECGLYAEARTMHMRQTIDLAGNACTGYCDSEDVGLCLALSWPFALLLFHQDYGWREIALFDVVETG